MILHNSANNLPKLISDVDEYPGARSTPEGIVDEQYG
jgi:hypothetical protein